MDPMTQFPKTGIIVDYYAGAYGPMLRLDTTSLDELLVIRNVFVDLAQERTDIINLLAVPGIIRNGVDRLILRRLESQNPLRKCLKLRKTRVKGIEFHWTMPRVDWWECVNLVDGLAGSSRPAHQYLNANREGLDDALIELTYMESSHMRGLPSE
jgi:hypothetical protein